MLRTCQIEALQAADQFFFCDDEEEEFQQKKGYIQMPCGTGKSRVLRCLLQIMHPVKSDITDPVCVVFPSLALIDQFIQEAHDTPISEHPMEWLCVCSRADEDVARRTTNGDEVEQWLEKWDEAAVARVVCVTYHSLSVVTKELDASIQFAFGFFDEAHWTDRRGMFDPDECDDRFQRQLFLTATPTRRMRDGLCFEDDETDDGSEGTCGPCIYKYGMSRGIEDNVLSGFEVRIELLPDMGQGFQLAELVARVAQETGNRRVLTFHQNVEKSVDEFVREVEPLAASGQVDWIESLRATDSSERRRELLDEFDQSADDEVVILSSCRTIGEGIDTKRANLVCFIDAKTNMVEIIQNVGRIMRFEEGKRGTVLIPCRVSREMVVKGSTMSPAERSEMIMKAFQSNGDSSTRDFRMVASVLAALLQEEDEVTEEMLRDLETAKFQTTATASSDSTKETAEWKGDQEVSSKASRSWTAKWHVSSDLAALWSFDDSALIQGSSRSVRLKCIGNPQMLIDRWNQTLDQLRVWMTTHEGKRPSKCSKNAEEKRLAQWISTQLNNFKQEKNALKLDDPRREQWADFVNQHEDAFCSAEDVWAQTLDQLRVWMTTHEGKRPSNSAKNADEKRLAQWISTQLNNFKQEKEAMKLGDPRRELWADFVNQHEDAFCSAEDVWAQTLDQLRVWMTTHEGKRPSKSSKNAEEKRLSNWISNQQQNFKQEKQAMKSGDPRREQWVDFVNQHEDAFCSAEDVWAQTLDQLRVWMTTHEGKRPSEKASKNAEEKRLAQWISTQQKNFKQEKEAMKPGDPRREQWADFVNQHEDAFCSAEDVWAQTLDQLQVWMATHEGKRPSQTAKDAEEKRLAQWISNQQKKFKQEKESMKLGDPRREQWADFVNQHEDAFCSAEDVWAQTLDQLRVWMTTHEGKRPSDSSKNAEEKRLAQWISTQLKNFKQKKQAMKPGDPRREQWVDFVNQHEDAFCSAEDVWAQTLDQLRVWMTARPGKRPSNSAKNAEEKRLAQWISTQLNNFKQEKQAMKLDDPRREQWADFVNQHEDAFCSAEDVWAQTLDQLRVWMATHEGKRPSGKSKNAEEKRLGSWISTQQQNFKQEKNALKLDDPRREQWADFVKQNPNAFCSAEERSISSSTISSRKRSRSPSPPLRRQQFVPIERPDFFDEGFWTPDRAGSSSSSSPSSVAAVHPLPFNRADNWIKDATSKRFAERLNAYPRGSIATQVLLLDGQELRTSTYLLESNSATYVHVVERDEATWNHHRANPRAGRIDQDRPIDLAAYLSKQEEWRMRTPFFAGVYFDLCGSLSESTATLLLQFTKHRYFISKQTTLGFTFCKRDPAGGTSFGTKVKQFLNKIDQQIAADNWQLDDVELYHYGGGSEDAAMCTLFMSVTEKKDGSNWMEKCSHWNV